MASLFDETIESTFQGLLKFTDNAIVTASLKQITDGLGNAVPLEISETQVKINENIFPTADGSADQVLSTDGSGNLSFVDVGEAEIEASGSWTPTFSGYDGSGDFTDKGLYYRRGGVCYCTLNWGASDPFPVNSDSSIIILDSDSLPIQTPYAGIFFIGGDWQSQTSSSGIGTCYSYGGGENPDISFTRFGTFGAASYDDWSGWRLYIQFSYPIEADV